MARLENQEITDREVWEDFIAKHQEANFLTSWYWGEFHKSLDKVVLRLGFYKSKKLVGVAQAVVEPAKRGRHVVVAGGPIIDWSDTELTSKFVEAIKTFAKQQNCLFVRVRPQLLNTNANRQLFKRLGFIKSPMHVTADLTSQLDLTKTDAELKKAMRKGTRYELNRSEKLNIKIETSKDSRYIAEFCELQSETAKRQHFVPFSDIFLTKQFEVFADAQKVLMYRSTYEGQLLAMAFVIFYGPEAAYHYGASTELARKYPGAYAIQWQAIQEARRRGCQRYNFWGVTEHGRTNHRFYGVSVFKRGFGGADVSYLPAHDLVVSPIGYLKTFSFESARRKLRKL